MPHFRKFYSIYQLCSHSTPCGKFWSTDPEVEIPFSLRDSALLYIFMLSFGLPPHRIGYSRFFHTFFLPKRERKYQRKRFRAAAKTPRGHRGCSALSALEMRRRLQRCNCSSQNEALAPLMGRKICVFGCSHDVPPKTPEGTWALAHAIHAAALKSLSTTAQSQSPRRGCIPDERIFSKCQPLYVALFPFFYFEEIKERFSQGCEDEARGYRCPASVNDCDTFMPLAA